MASYTYRTYNWAYFKDAVWLFNILTIFILIAGVTPEWHPRILQFRGNLLPLRAALFFGFFFSCKFPSKLLRSPRNIVLRKKEKADETLNRLLRNLFPHTIGLLIIICSSAITISGISLFLIWRRNIKFPANYVPKFSLFPRITRYYKKCLFSIIFIYSVWYVIIFK